MDANACQLCGDCLVRCPYLKLNRKQAVAEMRRLRAGEPGRRVLDHCASCGACDLFCPHDAQPYAAILAAWHERYLEQGLPERARYLMPASEPNFRTDLVKRFSAAEKATLEKWRCTPAEGELVIYPGCNTLCLPHLLDLDCLRDIPVSGDFELCCGEMYYRMGLFEEVEKAAERLSRHYAGRKIGTLLFVCPAGLNMFRNILPEHFGASFDFECRYLGDYLLERVEAGTLELAEIRPRSAAVHDSCHGRLLGEEVMETSRELYRRMGLTLRELAELLEEGLCCGMAAGCSRYRPDDIAKASLRELERARRSGADELALYCGGCQLTLAMLRWMYPLAPPVRHLLEYVAEATGQASQWPASRRSLRLLVQVAAKAFPGLLSRKTFRL